MIQPANARRVRPNMPRYGIDKEQTAGLLSWDWVARKMRAARNYWLSTTRPNGAPHAVPVWGLWVEGSYYFSTDRNSVKARNIRHDSRAVIHSESGDDTVIFEGRLIEAHPSSAMQAEIEQAYQEKYALDVEEIEGAVIQYRLEPSKVMAWLERDYPKTATYWLFDV